MNFEHFFPFSIEDMSLRYAYSSNISPLKSYEYLTVKGFSLPKLEKQLLRVKPMRTWDSWVEACCAFHHRMLLPTIPGEFSLEMSIRVQVWGELMTCWTQRDFGKDDVSSLEVSQNYTEHEMTQKSLCAETANTAWNLSTTHDLLAAFKEADCSQLCWPAAGKCGNMHLSSLWCTTQSFSSFFLTLVATSVISILPPQALEEGTKTLKTCPVRWRRSRLKIQSVLEKLQSMESETFPDRAWVVAGKQPPNPDFIAVWWHWQLIVMSQELLINHATKNETIAVGQTTNTSVGFREQGSLLRYQAKQGSDGIGSTSHETCTVFDQV